MKKFMIGFQKPRLVEVDEGSLTSTFGRFTAQPFEKGFATTVGNAVRRVLLSSIEGAAIVAVRFDGVVHEFSTIKGVWEDVLNIILNLKTIPLKMEGDGPKKLTLKKSGEGEVKSGDIKCPEGVEIFDKEIHIATLDTDGKIAIDMIVDKNFGYVPAEYNFDEELSVDYIPVDSVHCPIKNVKYTVENARVGFRTDYEKQNLEVVTNGTINPVEAVDKAAKILRQHLAIFLRSEDSFTLAKNDGEDDVYSSKVDLLASSINVLKLSARASNSLTQAQISHVYKLVQKEEKELMEVKKLGRKTLNEIIEKIHEHGFDLGVKLHQDLLKKIESKAKRSEEE